MSAQSIPDIDESPVRAALRRYWWATASFLVPFTLILSRTPFVGMDLGNGLKAGAIGFLTALVIFCVWKLDGGTNRAPSNDMKETIAKYFLGIMLWLVWMGSVHVMVIATDEVNEPLPVIAIPAN
jgi:hypothetical protein